IESSPFAHSAKAMVSAGGCPPCRARYRACVCQHHRISKESHAPPSALERAVERFEQGRIALVRAESLTAHPAARRQPWTYVRHTNPTWRLGVKMSQIPNPPW